MEERTRYCPTAPTMFYSYSFQSSWGDRRESNARLQLHVERSRHAFGERCFPTELQAGNEEVAPGRHAESPFLM